MRLRHNGFTALLLAIVVTVPLNFGSTKTVKAQELVQRDPRVIRALDNWGYQALYREGWSAKRLFNDATVYGPGGDELGALKNILLDREGRILGVVAEVGGFLNIGDTHVFIPWSQVEISTLRRVYVPVTEENIEEYQAAPSLITRALAKSVRVIGEDMRTGRDVWKATDLITDYVYVGDRVPFGYVRDLIFTRDGQLYAYVVSADATWGGGPYALPFTGDAWDPRSDSYNAPFDERAVRELDPLDYTRLDERIEVRGH